MHIRGRMFVLVTALILSTFACNPSDSALIVHVTNWPGDAAKLRLLVTFGGKPGQTSFVTPGTSQFSIGVPTGQAGQAVIEGMVQDSAGCYTAGKIVTADFAGNQGAQIQNVELRLFPYSTKACQVSFPLMTSGTHRLWGDRPDNYWLPTPATNAILRWDGSTWVSMSLPIAFNGAWGSRSGDVWAVSYSNGIVHWDGTAWAVVSSPAPGGLSSAWGSSGSDIWAVGFTSGGAGMILHWDGTAWAIVPSPASLAEAGWSIWGTSSSDVWAVGIISGGAGIILHWDGVAWTTIPSPALRFPNSVWGNSSSDVWVVAPQAGASGNILHWDGTAWATVSSPASPNPYSVWGSGSNDVWAVGVDGIILHWDGMSWATVPSPAPRALLTSVWGSSSSDAWAVGYNSAYRGTALHWDGTTWTALF